jgi:hypothetical protein
MASDKDKGEWRTRSPLKGTRPSLRVGSSCLLVGELKSLARDDRKKAREALKDKDEAPRKKRRGWGRPDVDMRGTYGEQASSDTGDKTDSEDETQLPKDQLPVRFIQS